MAFYDLCFLLLLLQIRFAFPAARSILVGFLCFGLMITAMPNFGTAIVSAWMLHSLDAEESSISIGIGFFFLYRVFR